MVSHAFRNLARLIVASLLVFPSAYADGAERRAEPLRFNRDIRPILADHCFACHGPDRVSRKAGLRLDLREKATAAGESGVVPIVPGKAEASELVRRVFAKSADEIMPPPSANKPLSVHQKDLLKRWISEGAKYEPHWGYLPPVRLTPPAVKHAAWPRNPVDRFILQRLEAEGLRPSPQADRATLFRRVSLDLTGLPPSPKDAAAFERESAAAPDPEAVYEAWVDRLLTSPHYGERMAVDWLDAARYADSNGYQVDRDRMMYAWRDWVIAAFNANEPYDRFTVEQLAGDLLPHATLAQKIATGFNRNHMLNEEGGVIPEEFYAEYCADRVETVGTIWLGQTIMCCRCHDHKFDPFTQRDFYSLVAFFHNVPESGLGNYGADIRRNAPPFIKLPAPQLEARISKLERERTETKKRLAALGAAKTAETKRLADQIASLSKQIQQTDLQIPTTLVMQEMPQPRPAYILIRGAYDKPGARVTAATPASLPAMSRDWPKNRLGLARWLVDPSNPLPARVAVNRFWQSLFGTGLVRTADDFGTQGEPPSHPELLDWLATELIRTGWNVKAMMRLLVTSETYRQSSRLTPALHERDPDNRLLSRGPRFRLQAEFLRDQALAASGLLVPRIGGPSVHPYNPAGLYEQVGAGNYTLGKGADLYRRSLYTYWKRSVPNPGMLVFDATFRESCTVKRSRSNTPLQALDLMNDPTYVEAARCLAQRMIRSGRATSERITRGFQLALARSPSPPELAILVAAHDRDVREFKTDSTSAAGLLHVGSSTADASVDPAELAAFTSLASTILNLDEMVTKE